MLASPLTSRFGKSPINRVPEDLAHPSCMGWRHQRSNTLHPCTFVPNIPSSRIINSARRRRSGCALEIGFGGSLGPRSHPTPCRRGLPTTCRCPYHRGRTPEHVVDFVLAANERGQDHAALVAALATEFGLSADDAALAVDRVGGGFVRAMTGNRHNCPDRAKDPIAWASFQQAVAKR